MHSYQWTIHHCCCAHSCCFGHTRFVRDCYHTYLIWLCRVSTCHTIVLRQFEQTEGLFYRLKCDMYRYISIVHLGNIIYEWSAAELGFFYQPDMHEIEIKRYHTPISTVNFFCYDFSKANKPKAEESHAVLSLAEHNQPPSHAHWILMVTA